MECRDVNLDPGTRYPFDPPEADKCLLASGELDVQRSTFIGVFFLFPDTLSDIEC